MKQKKYYLYDTSIKLSNEGESVNVSLYSIYDKEEQNLVCVTDKSLESINIEGFLYEIKDSLSKKYIEGAEDLIFDDQNNEVGENFIEFTMPAIMTMYIHKHCKDNSIPEATIEYKEDAPKLKLAS